MKKTEIQQRVLQRGKPLDLDKFTWCKTTNTFSSEEDDLVLDFYGVDKFVFILKGNCSTINVGDYSTINARSGSTINVGHNSTINAGYGSTINARSGSTIDVGYNSTINTENCSTIDVGDYSTINAGYGSTINVGHNSTINAGYGSTINARSGSTIDVGGEKVVIINRNIFEVIQPKKNDVIQICPYKIKGHLVNGELEGVPHIIADGILSRVVRKKGSVFKVINSGEKHESYLVKDSENYSHGKTLKEARDSLIYKLTEKDNSKYKDMNLDSVLSKAECIQMYRCITNACEGGVRYFVENLEEVKEKYKISEVIKMTEGQYNHQKLKDFFKE